MLSIVSGKRVVLIDDSIVRGTTSLRIVRMLREAGATEVHVRIASPMIKFPCFYGVDISTYDELLCARRTLEEARQKIEADSLAFLSESALYEAGKRSDLCLACFSGVYPTAHHWLILQGRYICTAKKPQCGECGLTRWCRELERARRGE